MTSATAGEKLFWFTWPELVQALKYEDCQKFDRHELYAEYHESEKIGKPPPPPTHEGEPASVTNSDSTKSSISSTQ